MLEIAYSLVPNSCIWAGASSLKGSIVARVYGRYLDVITEQLSLIISLTLCFNERVKEDIRNKMSLQSLDCGVCFLLFDNAGRRPIDLGCGHCFCQGCNASHPHSFRRCPECRVASTHPHPSFTLLRILAEVERVLEAQKGAAKVEIERALVSQMDRVLVIVKVAGERSLEALKVAFKEEMDMALVAENALQGKIWDSGRTHPDFRITNNQLTIKKEPNTTNSVFAVATINFPLTGSAFLGAAQIIDSLIMLTCSYFGVDSVT
jgi:hypothetical protein